MSEHSAIEWTDATFNPWWGCSKVSPGCDNCYAERDAKRYKPGKVLWGVDSERHRFGDKHWNAPVRWNKSARAAGKRVRVFCASMADVFDVDASPEDRLRLFTLIEDTQYLDWQILTKRIGNVRRMVPPSWLGGRWPAHAWLGASMVNQEEVDRDLWKLFALPAHVRFLSVEPMLGPILLPGFDGDHSYCNVCERIVRHSKTAPHDEEHRHFPEPYLTLTATYDMLHWVICGGESGPKARPMNPQWARDLRDECARGGIPFLHKQNGEFVSVSEVAGEGAHWTFDDGRTVRRVGKKAAGRLLDGVQHDGYPL